MFIQRMLDASNNYVEVYQDSYSGFVAKSSHSLATKHFNTWSDMVQFLKSNDLI